MSFLDKYMEMGCELTVYLKNGRSFHNVIITNIEVIGDDTFIEVSNSPTAINLYGEISNVFAASELQQLKVQR